MWRPLHYVQYSIALVARTRKRLTKDENFWTFAQPFLKWNRMIPKVAQDVDAASSYTWTKRKKKKKKKKKKEKT